MTVKPIVKAVHYALAELRYGPVGRYFPMFMVPGQGIVVSK